MTDYAAIMASDEFRAALEACPVPICDATLRICKGRVALELCGDEGKTYYTNYALDADEVVPHALWYWQAEIDRLAHCPSRVAMIMAAIAARKEG